MHGDGVGEMMMLEWGCREEGTGGTGDKNVGYRIPYQWTDRLMKGQAETVAAKRQDQLLTLLQRSELATRSMGSDHISIRKGHC